MENDFNLQSGHTFTPFKFNVQGLSGTSKKLLSLSLSSYSSSVSVRKTIEDKFLVDHSESRGVASWQLKILIFLCLYRTYDG